MNSSRILRALGSVVLGATFVASLTLMAGCGSHTSGASGDKNIKIATDLPVSGTDAGEGLPTEYGVDLAVSQNTDLGNGYKLSVVNKNDEGASGPDGSVGASNIQALVNDSEVMAIVGPFNSGVAKSEIPVVNQATLTLISPTNTNPGLTVEQYAAARGINFAQLHPTGKPDAYFRVCPTDVSQGKADASIALAAPINGKTAFVVDDNSVYGKGLADFFTSNFTAGGGTTAGTRTSITPDQVSNLGQLADTIKNANPDVVFYGGVTSQGGAALKKALVDKGFSKPMVGGDGIADDPEFIKTATPAASVNTYGTVAAPDTSTLSSSAAAKFVSDYKTFTSSKQDNDLLPYSAQSYDAAMIEITAIKNLIKAGKSVTRQAVRDQVASIQYNGITGQISFDGNGDNSGSKVFSVYGVDQSGAWKFQKLVNA